MHIDCLCKGPSDSSSQRRVLASDQLAVNHNLLGPALVSHDIDATTASDLIFKQLGHSRGEADDILPLVAESGNLAALEQGLLF